MNLMQIISICLVFVSSLLSVNLFIIFGDGLTEKVVLSFLAIIIELAKIKGADEIKTAENFRRKISFGLLYLITVIFSLFASVGFSLQAVNSNDNQSEIRMIRQKMKINEKQMENLMQLNGKFLSKTNAIYYRTTLRLQAKVNKINKENEDLNKRLMEAKKKSGNVMFILLGELFGLRSDVIELFLLILMSVGIELGIFLTIGEKKKRKRRESEISLRKILKEKTEWEKTE